MGYLFPAALSCRCPKISLDSTRLCGPIIHAEYGLKEEENSADVAVAICSISVFVKAASARNSSMRVLILDQAPHLNVNYRNHEVWRIPEELMKGIS